MVVEVVEVVVAAVVAVVVVIIVIVFYYDTEQNMLFMFLNYIRYQQSPDCL